MLWTIKSKTKIEYDLNGIMKLLTFKRILSPRSKFSMYLTKEEMYDDVKCTKDDLYRSLDILTKNKDELLFKINNQMVKLYNRTTTNTYYDVTNYYFEIEDEDEDENGEKGLRKKGLSKENRDLPIVQMGLLIDEKGLPITYDIFPGNQTDITTLKPFMEKYKKNLNVDDFTIVADKGLNSKGNLGYIDESGKKYVVAQKVRGCGKELLNQFLETK
jgi:transposase